MIFIANLFALFLLAEGRSAASSGNYNIARSLTIPGWIVTAILLLGVFFGARYLVRKISGKTKLK